MQRPLWNVGHDDPYPPSRWVIEEYDVFRATTREAKGGVMSTRTTWRRLATIFAAGLHDMTCTDHPELRDDCPYCRDAAALRVYLDKVSGQCARSWQDVVTTLADRFQHFTQCTTHSRGDADPHNCPFCNDEARWQQYVDFCGRQGVKPMRRDAEVMADGSVLVSIYALRSGLV